MDGGCILKIADYIWKIISVGFIIFLIPFLIYDGGLLSIFEDDGTKGNFYSLLWLYLALCIIYCFIGKKFISKMRSDLGIAISIFLLTAMPRLILLSKQIYIPTKDFDRYLNFGIDMYNGNYAAVADQIAVHSMPGMGGLAIWNGIIAKLFSPTLFGFQIANVVMVSLIAVLLYLLLKSYNKNVAIIAALLFALYPSSIVSTQITTNPHGAILLFLLAILCYQKAIMQQKMGQCICYTCITGL